LVHQTFVITASTNDYRPEVRIGGLPAERSCCYPWTGSLSLAASGFLVQMVQMVQMG
jgi:hypothetical protein